MRLPTPSVMLWLLSALLCVAQTVSAQPSEYQVKAAFLFNFGKFTDWPEGVFSAKDSPVVLCIAGRDPFGASLAAIEGKPVQGRELRIRRGVSVDEVAGCHLLFVPSSEERRAGMYARAGVAARTLVVGDVDGFAESGGAIALVNAENRIQFDVNLTVVNEAGLRLSSQMLRLARTVVGGKRQP